jgi:CRP-like cAMP-binding protein
MKDLISKIDFFSGLDEKILRKLSDACIMRQFTKNETIVRQGEMGLGLYLIAKGRVKVDREQAGVRMQVAELGPEQFFGEMSLLDNKPRSATVTGLEDSECVLLTRDSFVRLMNKYPEIPIRMARVLAERLRVANEKLAAGPTPAAAAATPAAAASAPPPQPAAAAEPAGSAPAAAAASNGATPGAPEAAGTKAQIHQKLLDTFQSLYTIKALSRFSVAVLGCPVEGTAANLVDQIRVGEVKALFFSADEPVDMRIAAEEPGWFTLDVFTPSSENPCHFGPLAVAPTDSVHMTLISGQVALHYSERLIECVQREPRK